jgi:hypothetical protein
MLKKGKALRDKRNTLILPLVTIIRKSIEQNSTDDVTGRGINQQTGELVVHRRLDASDRNYQSLINRLLLRDQDNLAIDVNDADPTQLSTSRTIGDLADDPVVQDGGLMLPNRRKNIYETIVVPSPQFYTAEYEVTFWTQYIQHMNQLIETLVSSYLPQGNAWQLNTNAGYWFVATIKDGKFEPEQNFDDMAGKERMLKHKFTVMVPAYIFATATPGAPIPVRRYVSSPDVTFSISLDEVPDSVEEPFIGADDPTLPLAVSTTRDDVRETNSVRMYPNKSAVCEDDPALLNDRRGIDRSKYKRLVFTDSHGNTVEKYVRIKSINQATGEMVFSADFEL